MDFEQLAFIEKWRQKASRGVVIVLDGTHGDILVTLRVGEGAGRIDMRGQDATGALRKQRLAIGDRITIAIEYAARDLRAGSGRKAVSGGLVAPGANIEGVVTAIGEVAVVDCGAQMLVRGDTLVTVSVGDPVAFSVSAEGRAYFIPTRG